MAAVSIMPAPLAPAAAGGQIGRAALPASTPHEKAKRAAEEFEAVFLNSMFQQMFTGIDGDGPFGGGVWRSFLADEYAKSFAKSGGIGIGCEVYSTLLAIQEGKGR